jgi:hypothetical protein
MTGKSHVTDLQPLITLCRFRPLPDLARVSRRCNATSPKRTLAAERSILAWSMTATRDRVAVRFKRDERVLYGTRQPFKANVQKLV